MVQRKANTVPPLLLRRRSLILAVDISFASNAPNIAGQIPSCHLSELFVYHPFRLSIPSFISANWLYRVHNLRRDWRHLYRNTLYDWRSIVNIKLWGCQRIAYLLILYANRLLRHLRLLSVEMNLLLTILVKLLGLSVLNVEIITILRLSILISLHFF